MNGRAATFTMVHCAETNAEARRNAEASIIWYFRRSIELIGSLAAWQEGRDLGTLRLHPGAPRPRHLRDVTFDMLDEMDAVIVGDPERCIERVRRYREAGCDQLLCLMQPYAIPPDEGHALDRALRAHVIPAFR